MKKIIILILFLFAILQFNSFAEYKNTRVRLFLKTKLGEVFNNLVFGIDKDATDYLDRALDEQELFPGHPPSGLHAVFVIYDLAQREFVWSYLDLKAFPDLDTGYKYYRIDVQYHVGDNLIFEWKPFGDEIREAWISDIITGNIVKINMKDSTSAFVDNQFIKKFDIKVKYESSISVSEQEGQTLQTFPNPVADRLSISLNKDVSEYRIFNLIGNQIISNEITDKKSTIDVSSLASGVYIIKFYSNNIEAIVKKFVKF